MLMNRVSLTQWSICIVYFLMLWNHLYLKIITVFHLILYECWIIIIISLLFVMGLKELSFWTVLSRVHNVVRYGLIFLFLLLMLNRILYLQCKWIILQLQVWDWVNEWWIGYNSSLPLSSFNPYSPIQPAQEMRSMNMSIQSIVTDDNPISSEPTTV